MRAIWLILLVLTPAILYGMALLAVALKARYLPRCHERGLKVEQFIRATIKVRGQRAPGYWADYACSSCGAKLRWRRRRWEVLA